MSVELEVVEREPVELTTTAIIPAPVVGGVPAEQIQQWDAETLDVAKAHAQGLVEDIVFPEPTELAWDAVADKPAEFPPSAHRHEWDELDDIPATFAPSAHTHPWGQVTDVPEVFPPALHFHTWASIEDKPLVFPPSSHTHLWEQIANVPASFPPSAHSHAWGDVTGKPTTFTPAAHTHTVSQIADMPATPTWGTLGGKPTTFPPSAHQHAASDITSGTFEVARLGTGTAGAGKALFGDGTWKDAPTGGSTGAWYDSGPRNLATALAIRVQRVDGTVTVSANNGAGSYSPGSANNGILPAGTLPVGMRPKYAENTFIFSASPANTPFIFRVNPDGSISVHSYGPNITITYGACTLSFAPASLAIPASMPGTPG